MQEWGALGLLALAVCFLVWRYASRRASGNCCGKKECPAAREMVDKINRHTG